ncbi:MAG: hypothetical protein JWM42_595, partial [Burkholderia sp.]|nr:hypothetical protein [Burkholderia sp.]
MLFRCCDPSHLYREAAMKTELIGDYEIEYAGVQL